jgi:sarcosine oxidase, subunit gamma
MHEGAPTAAARSALHGLNLPELSDQVSVREADVANRFIYRGAPALIEPAIGFTLPTMPCRATTHGAGSALWLGPDEWLLIETANAPTMFRTAKPTGPAALVDVSHRNCGLVVAGPEAARLLNAACPLDLDPSVFPVGMCTRTLFGKAEIVLWRTATDTFRLELWRSFAPYVTGLLTEALRDIA